MIDSKHFRGACLDCSATLIVHTYWRAGTKEQRQAWTAQGLRRLHGRGLCSRDYNIRNKAGTLADVQPWHITSEELLAEWEIVCDPYDSIRKQARQLADRLDMSFDAVERALYRAGIRSKLAIGGHRYKTEAA